MTEITPNEIQQNNSSIHSTNDSPKSETIKQWLKEKELTKNRIWLEKLKSKLTSLNGEVENLKEENKIIAEQYLCNQQQKEQLKEQLQKSKQLSMENEEFNTKNAQLAAEILYHSEMKYQKPLEKFPKAIKKVKILKNFPNNLWIQSKILSMIYNQYKDLNLQEGQMLNGDEVEAILSSKTYNIVTEVPWSEKQFLVSWRKRKNGYKPTKSWVNGKLMDQHYQKMLCDYYQQHSNFFG